MLMLSYPCLLNAYVFVQALMETSLLSLHSWGPRQGWWGGATKPLQPRPALKPHKSAEPYLILEIPRNNDPVYEIIICRIYPNALFVSDCICKSIIWTNWKKMPWQVQWGLKERILSCWGEPHPISEPPMSSSLRSGFRVLRHKQRRSHERRVGFQLHFPWFPSQIIFAEWRNNWRI